MKRKAVLSTTAAMMLSMSMQAQAAGELNIFTWGNIIAPEVVKKFEEQYDVKVILTDYDSSDGALVKVRQGGHGFDGAIVISSYVPLWIEEGLLEETNPGLMENAHNIKDEWKNPAYDPGMKYTVPYEIGITGIAVNTSIYKGDINSSALVFDPPPELVGKINIVPTMDEIMYLATHYVGGKACSTDPDIMRKVRDVLVEARPKWASIDYGTIDNYAKGDIYAGIAWNGANLRARTINPQIHFGFPREGFPVWIDTFAVLKSGKNHENAKLFQNFLMTAQSGGAISTFTGYANAIKGSEEFMADHLRQAPELQISEDVRANMGFLRACPPEAQAFQNAIWTAIQK